MLSSPSAWFKTPAGVSSRLQIPYYLARNAQARGRDGSILTFPDRKWFADVSNVSSVIFAQAFFFTQRTDDMQNRGFIETVTVVAYPSGIFSTLRVSAALEDSSSAPASQSSLAPSSNALSSSSLARSTSTFGTVTSLPPRIGSLVPSLSRAITPLGSSTTISTGAAASNLSSQPPVYVGIAFGSIAAIGVLAALVAWCIRRWFRHRRRRNNTVLPWVDDYSGLEAGSKDSATDWSANPKVLPGRGTTRPSTRQWLSTDRDVGEPRRSDSFGAVPDYSSKVPADGVGDRTFDGHSARKPTMRRQLPSHLVDEKLSAQAQTLRPDDEAGCDSELGTPREDVVVPRYLSLNGDALDLPWSNKSPHKSPPRSMAERLRRASKLAKEGCEPARPSDFSGRRIRDARQEKPEGWAESITSNLVNAFNAVAANIATSKAEEEDFDTHRRKPSMRGTVWNASQLDRRFDTSARRGGLEARAGRDLHGSSTELHEPWTLEELPDGTGIVHLHISPSRDRSLSRTSSSLYSSDTPSAVPLIASRGPPPVALMKTEGSRHFRLGTDHVAPRLSGTLESSSSSTNALTSHRNRRPRPKRGKGLHHDAELLTPTPYGRLSGPSLISRLSSTSSATSWNSHSSRPATSEIADALRARKRPS